MSQKKRKNKLKKIMKYDLNEVNSCTMNLPINAQILGVANIYGAACIFALINMEETKTETRTFRRVRIGMPAPDDISSCKYLGTYLVESYGTIWSIFEEPRKMVCVAIPAGKYSPGQIIETVPVEVVPKEETPVESEMMDRPVLG